MHRWTSNCATAFLGKRPLKDVLVAQAGLLLLRELSSVVSSALQGVAEENGTELHMEFCRRLYSASSPKGSREKSPGVIGSRGLYRKSRGWGRTSGPII